MQQRGGPPYHPSPPVTLLQSRDNGNIVWQGYCRTLEIECSAWEAASGNKILLVVNNQRSASQHAATVALNHLAQRSTTSQQGGGHPSQKVTLTLSRDNLFGGDTLVHGKLLLPLDIHCPSPNMQQSSRQTSCNMGGSALPPF